MMFPACPRYSVIRSKRGSPAQPERKTATQTKTGNRAVRMRKSGAIERVRQVASSAGKEPLRSERRSVIEAATFFPMPTYEYQCDKCGKNFEVFQSMKDAALTTCPKELCRQK